MKEKKDYAYIIEEKVKTTDEEPEEYFYSVGVYWPNNEKNITSEHTIFFNPEHAKIYYKQLVIEKLLRNLKK